MDMEQSLDVASKARDELIAVLADEIAGGVIDLLTPGTTGELHGQHHPTVGVHLTVDVISFRKMKSALMHKVKPIRDNGVAVSFFPAERTASRSGKTA